MKKFIVLLVLAGSVVFADEALPNKCWEVFALDHKGFDDVVKSVKIMKRIEKINEVYFEEKNAFTPSAEDKSRGFALFTKPSGNDIYPNTLPSKQELVQAYSVSGARGELAPVVICVLPDKAAQEARISVFDLVSDTGAKIPKENISVKHLDYDYMQVGADWMVKARYVMDGVVDIPAGVTRAFRVMVNIPPDVAPGIYQGKANVTFAGKLKAEVPVSVEVLPFELLPLSGKDMFWMWEYSEYFENKILEKRLINLREHGMNTLCNGLPFTLKIEGSKVSADWSTAERVGPLLKKYGFSKWMINNFIYDAIAKQANLKRWGPEHKKILKDILAEFKARAEKGGWPELYWITEELAKENTGGPEGEYTDMVEFSKLLAEAGIHSNLAWGAHYFINEKYKEIAQYAYCNSAMAPIKSQEKVVTDLASLSQPLYLFDCGPNRFAFGALVKQKHALGNSQFWYCATRYGDPTVGMASASCAVFDKDNNPVDTLQWDQIREGIYDYRYISTLETALANCKDKASPEAAAAKAVLDKMLQLKWKPFEGEFDDTSTEFMSVEQARYDAGELDRMRDEVIKSIIGLKSR